MSSCSPRLGERLAAMGVSSELFQEADYDYHALIERVLQDNEFVRQNRLESLRETLSLAYPSYILALAMGAGKTILMGTIVATEFAMAEEYPDGPFVQNALIFAPGKTIIESLREIADMPFERILPARMYKPFAAGLKLTFTRDGDKELSGVVGGSRFNVVVTNTEKIRIQKSTGARAAQINLPFQAEDPAVEIANLRLQAIASLPHLAVFSDEAHHTYGQKLLGRWVKVKGADDYEFQDQGIKKVRKTVDYLARETNLLVVVNTTGHRIILLVNMGTEGWNCPSLFATALVRKLKTSNNFVLQAATRCLRQVPGNTHPARIYLTRDNKAILGKQLQETYGTSIKDLGKDRTERVEQRIELRNWQMPPLRFRPTITCRPAAY